MTPRRDGPQSRRPEMCPWYGAECPHCADPVTRVVLDVTRPGEGNALDPLRGDRRVPIDRRVHPQGTIAARVIGSQMHGYRLGPGRPLVAGYRPFREHLAVCPESPPPPHEQPALFDDTEGTTTT